MQRTGRFFFVMIIVLSVPVVALLLWQRGHRFFAGPVEIDEAIVCRELDDSSRPVGEASVFQWGGRQVCLMFRYEAPRPGSVMDIVWRFQDRVIFRESLRIGETSGSKAFFLLREDGSPLPVGEYDVAIESDGKERCRIPFSVVR
ncbi:MAG TPA: hypothetical protein PLS21_06060 [Synergistales bacterium]|nr:hypothetical protein [Synergistales bacterium]